MLTYDDGGNLQTLRDSLNQETVEYVIDGWNRLTAVRYSILDRAAYS